MVIVSTRDFRTNQTKYLNLAKAGEHVVLKSRAGNFRIYPEKSDAKKYPSFKKDYEIFLESLQENPLQGDELTPGIRKIRMAIKSKGKGKSGGARVITYNVIAEQHNGIIALLLIYDKSDFSTVDVSVVKQIVHDEGYETE